MRRFVLPIAAAAIMSMSWSFAADEEIYGTYRLISTSQRVLETGEIVTLAKEQGFITYGRDGRMMVLITRGDRPKPESFEKMTDQHRIDLFRSMTAYAGTFKFDGKTLEHHVDISSDEMWTGTTQFRDVKRDGERLSISTRPIPSPRDGRISVTTLVWEKVK
jgi:Lipocalin-like domain